MPFPYKKMTEEDFAYLRGVTAPERVWVGDEIAREYYHDEMPEYGVFPPELYVEVLDKQEVSRIMKYAWEQNIPVVVRGAGTGLAGGANCKYGGMRAVRYGLTRDFVRCIEAVLPDGEIVQFSSNVVKNTTGYDIKDLVIGSEGTLCILTEVTLKLMPAPKFTRTLVMPFENLESCIDMVPRLLQMAAVPTAIEFLERELIDIVERNLHKLLPVKEGDAVLIVMYDAGSEQELLSACTEASDAALEAGAIDVYIADTPERIASVWSVRGAILEGMKAESVAQEECDVVVPRAKIAEYVRLAKGIGAKYGIRVEPCGHAGDGNIHTEMLRDASMSDEDWIKGTRACLTELYGVSKQFGGQLSGEHGIGNGRLEYLKPFVGDRMYKLYQSIKLAFDEKLILNPGKIITFEE